MSCLALSRPLSDRVSRTATPAVAAPEAGTVRQNGPVLQAPVSLTPYYIIPRGAGKPYIISLFQHDVSCPCTHVIKYFCRTEQLSRHQMLTVLPLSIQTLCELHRHVASPNDMISSIRRLHSKHLDCAYAMASNLFTMLLCIPP